ncbi:TniB NTP-binding protein [Paramagnetospirillum magnetotacticum MS-1]|uniref:TniB NTP-binding protein n=2 Tax=Paramagnetospirillum magnetotacticum TaxID=188 RepID=A0A0C2YLA7_PARME|nr:TniB NTP-binding protein [Paramagnetospirillum magnetotacticum MS-1]
MQMSGIAAEPSCLLATGLSGSGKSTIAKALVHGHPAIETEFRRTMPVLMIDVPAAATAKGLATSLLAAMKDNNYARGSVASQTERIYRLIRECEVRLLILDEFQHLIDEDKRKIIQTSADWLKSLINMTKVPVLLLGIHKSQRILDYNEQLRRRFSRIIELHPYDWGIEAHRKDFRGVIKAIASRLPFDQAPDLWNHSAAFALYQASSGLIGHAIHVIRKASEAAILADETVLSPTRLAEAYDQVIVNLLPRGYAAPRNNPFLDEKVLERTPLQPGALSLINDSVDTKHLRPHDVLTTR